MRKKFGSYRPAVVELATELDLKCIESRLEESHSHTFDLNGLLSQVLSNSNTIKLADPFIYFFA